MTQNDTRFMDSAMALAETLHFTKAAKRLRISQPQLTKNIQGLEDILGYRLFDRDRKTVVLNDAGRAYIEKARLSIMYAERAFQSALSLNSPASSLSSLSTRCSTAPSTWQSQPSLQNRPCSQPLRFGIALLHSHVKERQAGGLSFRNARIPFGPMLDLVRAEVAPSGLRRNNASCEAERRSPQEDSAHYSTGRGIPLLGRW
jgi:hypothetical protein